MPSKVLVYFIYVVYLGYLFLYTKNLNAPGVWWKKDFFFSEMGETKMGNKRIREHSKALSFLSATHPF